MFTVMVLRTMEQKQQERNKTASEKFERLSMGVLKTFCTYMFDPVDVRFRSACGFAFESDGLTFLFDGISVRPSPDRRASCGKK